LQTQAQKFIMTPLGITTCDYYQKGRRYDRR